MSLSYGYWLSTPVSGDGALAYIVSSSVVLMATSLTMMLYTCNKGQLTVFALL